MQINTKDCDTTYEEHKKIVYISSKSVQNQLEKLPAIFNRTTVVDKLIASYGLLEKCHTISPEKCSSDDLLIFHSSDYVDCLKRFNEVDDLSEVTEELEEFGIAYDCPLLERIYDYVTTVAGSTLAAVDAILNGAKIAINWSGGWHHAQRDSAAGFCYVNDIVIGIQRLRSKYQKVLYLDLDVHHGGYNIINTAKYWTQLTAAILNVEISKDIPENDFFLDFGPDFVIDVFKRNVKDKNSKQDLCKKVSIIKDNLKRYVRSAS